MPAKETVKDVQSQKSNDGADTGLTQHEAAELSLKLQESQRDLKKLAGELHAARVEIARVNNDLNIITHSRIWRYTARLRKFVLSIRRFRGRILFYWQKPSLNTESLTTSKNISAANASLSRSYLVDLNRVVIGRGWNAFKIKYLSPEERESAVLYIDYGNGFSEENKLCFSSFSKMGVAVANIGNDVKGLKLSIASSGFPQLLLRPVTKWEALLHYACLYIQRQREAGIPLLQAVSGKVRALGGWKALRPNKLTGYIQSYEAVRQKHVIGDLIIEDYETWIEQYETPYMDAQYGRPCGKHNQLVIVSLGGALELPATMAHSKLVEYLVVNNGSKGWVNTEQGNVLEVTNTRDMISALCLRFKEENTYYVFVEQPIHFSEYFHDALEHHVQKLQVHPLVIYTDSDQMDEDGNRQTPYFKPMWSPVFQCGSRYMGPVITFSKPFIDGLKDELNEIPIVESAQCLLLTGISQLNNKNVLHIPEVHFHAIEKGSREPVSEKTLKQILPAFEKNKEGFAIPCLPEIKPKVSIIIPTRDQFVLLDKCISSIQSKSSYRNFEIIIIDNGSEEKEAIDYLDQLEQVENIEVLRDPGPFNYSALNNQAVDMSTGEVLILLNNDIEVITENWIEELLRFSMLPGIGCVGAKLLYPDQRIQHAGVILGINGVGVHASRLEDRDNGGYCDRLFFPQEMTAVTAACLAVRRSVFEQVGGLNAKDLTVAFNDVDFCLKVWESGYSNIWTPMAELFHHESVSRGEDNSPEKAARLAKEASYIMQRWGGILKNDPAYSPNLSLRSGGFKLSTRYFSEAMQILHGSEVNPCQQPYFYENNIARINKVLANSPAAEKKIKPEKVPGLSIIILTLERYDLISMLLQSLVAAKEKIREEWGFSIEIIVGDTGSTSKEVMRLYDELEEEIKLVRNMKYHFSRCNNDLFKECAQFETVLFLNNDIVFEDPVVALGNMYSTLNKNDHLGVVGPYMEYPDGTLQHGGVDIFTSGDSKGLCFHPGHGTTFSLPALGFSKRYPAVTGACMMMSSKLFSSCDYFDESFEAEAQDVDLCLKARRYGLGVDVLYVGKIVHYENGTRKKGDYNQRDRSRFIRKWRFYQEVFLNG